MNEKDVKQLIEDTVKETVETTKDVVKNIVKEELNDYGFKEDKKSEMAKFLSAPMINVGATEEKNVKELPKGHAFAKIVKLAHRANNDRDKMAWLAKKELSYKAPVFVKRLENWAKDGQSVTIPSEGGFLVHEQYANEVVELLRPKVFLYQLGARRRPLPNGNLNLPVHTAGALSYFVGEGSKATVKKQQIGNIKFNAKKQVSLILTTDELIKNNSYNADQAFLNDMLTEMAVTMNTAALTGSGTEYTPKGIKNYAGVKKVTLGSKVTNTTLSTIKGTLMANNTPKEKLGWVFNGVLWSQFYELTDGNGAFLYQNSMDNGKLIGDPYVIHNGIPVGTSGNKVTDIFYGDWSEFEIAEQDMFLVDTTKEATIEVNGTTINLFQNGWQAIKVTSFYDFALRHENAFTVYTVDTI